MTNIRNQEYSRRGRLVLPSFSPEFLVYGPLAATRVYVHQQYPALHASGNKSNVLCGPIRYGGFVSGLRPPGATSDGTLALRCLSHSIEERKWRPARCLWMSRNAKLQQLQDSSTCSPSRS